MQAVDAAVSAAVADARVKTKEEVEAASAAKKAAADQQLLRELEDKTAALTTQLAAATEQLRSAETALRSDSWLLSATGNNCGMVCVYLPAHGVCTTCISLVSVHTAWLAVASEQLCSMNRFQELN